MKKIVSCSISSDCWTSNSQMAYLGVTCHFIDEGLKFNSIVLNLKYLEEDHSSEFLYSSHLEILKNWSIEDKVLILFNQHFAILINFFKLISATSDSGSNFKGALNMFDAKIHKIPCAAHKLNLCVNDMFRVKKISENKNKFYVFDYNEDGDLRKKEISPNEKLSIEFINETKSKVLKILKKCKSLVGSFKHSEKLNRQLKETQRNLKYSNPIKLVQDVCTRWEVLMISSTQFWKINQHFFQSL